MGDQVRLRRGFHAGRFRGQAPPRARIGGARGVAGDPSRGRHAAGCARLGERGSGITVRPHNRAHRTQVIVHPVKYG